MAKLSKFFEGGLIYGNEVEWYDTGKGLDIRLSDGTLIDSIKNLKCPKCSRHPFPDGRDACLIKIPHCVSACCGHGRVRPQIVRTWGRFIGYRWPSHRWKIAKRYYSG